MWSRVFCSDQKRNRTAFKYFVPVILVDALSKSFIRVWDEPTVVTNYISTVTERDLGRLRQRDLA